MAAGARKSIASPSKKLTMGKQSSGGSPSMRQQLPAVDAEGKVILSRIVEMMMDKICPMNLAQSEGLGADNMTCMIIEFQKS